MLANPVAVAAGHFQREINIGTGIIRAVDPFGEAQVRVEKNNDVWMNEFFSSFANLDTDRFEQCDDVRLRCSADRPAQRDIFTLPIFRQAFRVVARIKREQKHARYPWIGRRTGQRRLQLLDISERWPGTTGVNWQEHDWIAG